MADPLGPASATNQTNATVRTRERRSNIIRRTVYLAVATVALAAFVAGLGDVRRRDWAMSQSRWYRSALATRLTEQGDWPIDLQVDADQTENQSAPAEMYKFKWLSAHDAQRLAHTDQSILVAWTQLVPQTIWPDGRGCVVFEGSSFDTEWLSHEAFEKRIKTQLAQ